MSDASTPDGGRTKSDEVVGGLSPEVAAALAYPFAPLSGLILFVIEDESEFVRFHAMQGLLFGAICVPIVVFTYPILIGVLLTPVYAIAALILAVRAYRGEEYELPVIGRLARRRAAAVAVPPAETG